MHETVTTDFGSILVKRTRKNLSAYATCCQHSFRYCSHISPDWFLQRTWRRWMMTRQKTISTMLTKILRRQRQRDLNLVPQVLCQCQTNELTFLQNNDHCQCHHLVWKMDTRYEKSNS